MSQQQRQAQPLPIHVHFTTNWGVSTGVGSRGINNSTVETDTQGFPIVRGTTLTGILREQAELAAQALDADASPGGEGSWQKFVATIFGNRGTTTNNAPHNGTPHSPASDGAQNSVGTTARLISFSDATVDARDSLSGKLTSSVSIAIDPDSGTVRDNFFRVIERAAPTSLNGWVNFLDTDHAGNAIAWTDEQRNAVAFILSLAATLVRGIGSERSAGDGECVVIVGEHPTSDDKPEESSLCDRAGVQRQWCRQQMDTYCPVGDDGKRRAVQPPALPQADENISSAPRVTRKEDAGAASPETRGGNTRFYEVPLTIELSQPVVSYDVPMSNEIRTLDFIRGTTLLPWVHKRLRAANPDSELVRDAVINADLFVTDATLMLQAEATTMQDTSGESSAQTPHTWDEPASFPVPLCLSRPKNEANAVTHVVNRLRATPPRDENQQEENHVPLRGGFLFAATTGTDAHDKYKRVSIGRPDLVGRQSSAHNALTGATASGQLFLVRALAAGQFFAGTVLMSKRLRDALGSVSVQDLLGGEMRLGMRKFSGAYGVASCSAGHARELPERPTYWKEDGPWCKEPVKPEQSEQGQSASTDGVLVEDDQFSTTVWCVSDLLVRSESLGAGGSSDDVIRAFRAAGVDVELVPQDGELFTTSIRHRRVDSWSGGSGSDGQPRPTRVAVQAGSVLRVRPVADSDLHSVEAALARITRTGLGDLCAQGFGRIVVGHPFLNKLTLDVVPLGSAVEEGIVAE